MLKFIKILFIFLVSFFILITIALFWMTSIKVEGKSMEPTFYNGEILFFNFFSSSKINDVIVFDCFSKCTLSGKAITLVKRLDKIDGNGCYWVEGDNKEHSFDSRNYGWLCPSDFGSDRTVIFNF